MNKITKVLIIDGHDKRALASVRNIGEKKENFKIYVGSKRAINATRFSRYCDVFVKYPDPATHTEDFLKFLKDYIQKEKIDILFPMDDAMAEIISQNYDFFSSVVKMLIPEWETFNVARDKGLTLDAAVKCGIPIPESYTIEEVKNNPGIKFPLLIKPRISNGGIGISIVNTLEELKSEYDRINKSFEKPLIQEVIDKSGGIYQVNILFDDSHELVCSAIKTKLRQFPLTGGPATFFKTIENAEAEEYSVRLLKSINWIGPAEVEFMVDPKNGVPKLLEINPRMSANIVLSCYAGVDIPYYVVKTLIGERPVNPIKNKNLEYYCQSFFPGDLLNFILNKERFRQEYGYFTNKPEKICHMTYSSTDVKPFFFNTLALGISAINPKKLVRFLLRN